MEDKNELKPGDLAALKALTGEGSLYDGALIFTYLVHSPPAGEIQAHDEAMKDMTPDERMYRNLAFVVDCDLVGWDLTDQGVPIPLESAVVLKLVPLSLLNDLYNELRRLRLEVRQAVGGGRREITTVQRGGKKWN